jgi:hypothetical protein
MYKAEESEGVSEDELGEQELKKKEKRRKKIIARFIASNYI